MRLSHLLLAALAGFGPGLPVLATGEAQAASRVPLFSCATDANDNALTLSGEVDDKGDIGALLFTAPDGTVWPEDGAADPNFYMSVSSGAEGYLIEVAFGGPDRFFRLFSLDIPAASGEAGRSDGGLVFTGVDGKRARVFTCVERPIVYQGDLEKATECDSSTPLGEAACNILAPPQRTAPLALPSAQ